MGYKNLPVIQGVAIPHDLGGSEHIADSLADLNSKVTDGTLIDTGDARLSDDRDPTAHDLGGSDHNAATLAELNALISDANVDDDGDPRPPTAHNHTAAETTSGTFDDARIAESNVTQHEAAIDHDALTNYLIAQHRIINDSGSTTTELFSASKILSLVSASAANRDTKDSVVTVADSDITLSGEQTINGVLTSTSRIGVVGQSDASENGIYITAAGTWVRSTDADEDSEVTNGLNFFVSGGASTKNGSEYLLITADPITVDTTALSFIEIPRIELGTTSGTAAEGDDARIPTQDENDALTGTDGTPSSSNKYVTNTDSRNTNSRVPTGTAAGDLAGTYPNPTVGLNKVTNAKLAQMGANTIKGNNTGGLLDPKDLTDSEVTAMLLIDLGTFYAENLRGTDSADFAISDEAPPVVDSNNNAINVRAFNDTLEEGVARKICIPATATSIKFTYSSRAETAPGGAATVKLNFYEREIPDNAAPTAWSSAIQLTDISIPTNEFFQLDTQTITLATLGLTAGKKHQIILSRDATDGGDDLADDWNLLYWKVEYT